MYKKVLSWNKCREESTFLHPNELLTTLSTPKKRPLNVNGYLIPLPSKTNTTCQATLKYRAQPRQTITGKKCSTTVTFKRNCCIPWKVCKYKSYYKQLIALCFKLKDKSTRWGLTNSEKTSLKLNNCTLGSSLGSWDQTIKGYQMQGVNLYTLDRKRYWMKQLSTFFNGWIRY